MDAVFQYRIPELHPLVVHFPLALLMAAALTGIVWTWVGTPFWRNVTWLIAGLGTAGAFVAYFTGESMKEQSEGVPIVEQLVGLHEDMALYTLIAACAATAALGAQAWWGWHGDLNRDPLLQRVLIGLLILAAGALVAWTGHIGATMVWGVAG